MRLRNSIGKALLAFAVAALPAGAGVIFDRGLPTANVNAAGSNRSNVNWQTGYYDGSLAGPYVLQGDDFSFTYNALINTITVYEVSNTLIGGGSTSPDSEFNSISLWYGLAGGPLTNSVTLNNAALALAPQVQYFGGLDYQGSNPLDTYAIYALTFNLGGYLAAANTTYAFALDSDPFASNILYLHASNAGLSGSTQQGADDLLRLYSNAVAFPNGPAGPFASAGFCSSDPATFPALDCGNGWNKASDFNVVINGSTPEPSSFVLMGIGAGAMLIGGYRSRKRKL